jgi:hypothetical protein
MVVTDSAGRLSMADAMVDLGIGTKPILQANVWTDRARLMLSNSR